MTHDLLSLTQPHVRIDMNAYYETFKAAHGLPLEVQEGTLVFPDGWTYSAVWGDHWEKAPPKNKDDLRALLMGYWTMKRNMVRAERDRIWQEMENLKQLQSMRSLPLQMLVPEYDDEGKRVGKNRSGPVDFEVLEFKHRCMNEDLAEAEDRLKELAERTAHGEEAIDERPLQSVC